MRKLIGALILATVLLTVASPAFAGPAAPVSEPTTSELVTLAKTRAAGAQSGVTAAERADSLAQAATWARKDAAAFQATANADLAAARNAAGAIPALPVAPATITVTSGLTIEDIARVLEAISTTPLVDTTARAYATEVAKNALSRAKGSAAEAAKWDERASTLEKSAREAYQQAKDLLMPATSAPAVAPVTTAPVAPSATPATVTAPASPSAAEVQLRKELAAEKARADRLETRIAELEKKAVAPAALKPAERAEDTPDAGTWPQNLPKPATTPVPAPTAATPATTAPTAPVAQTPAPAAAPIAPSTPADQVKAPLAGQPAAGTTPPADAATAPVVEYATKRDLDDVSGLAGRIGGRVSKVEDAVKGIDGLKGEIAALRSEIIALKDAQAAEIAGLRKQIVDLGKVQAETLRVQGEAITTLRTDLEAFQRQLVLTWIIAGGLLLIGLLFAAAIGARPARQVARREEEDEAARAAADTTTGGTTTVVAPVTGGRAPATTT